MLARPASNAQKISTSGSAEQKYIPLLDPQNLVNNIMGPKQMAIFNFCDAY